MRRSSGVTVANSMSALREQVFQNDGGVVDDVGIVLRFDYEADFALFEAVEHIGGGGGFQCLHI